MDSFNLILSMKYLVQLQLNLRSMLDVANGLEPSYVGSANMPFSDRTVYLNDICINQTDKFQSLTLR